MYFLSEEEKRWVLRYLAPQARARGVAEDLRGWNWHQPPLSPIYDKTLLGVSEVAGQYCPTGRDLYLRRVLNVRVPPSRPMVQGAYLHAILYRIVMAAKRALYTCASSDPFGPSTRLRTGVAQENPSRTEGDPIKALRVLDHPDLAPIDDDSALREPQDSAQDESLPVKGSILWDFQARRIVTRVQEVLAHQPHIGMDSLVNLALPVIVEQRLNGTFLGLTPHLSADAFVWSEQMVVDIKFGRKQPFHRLSTTGYALAIESIYEYPVNIGCVVYVSFQEGQVLIERDIHHIDDELRQWFIESRDERARLIEEEIDPGLPHTCPEVCPYYPVCHPE